MPTISKINGITIANIAKINGIVKANISKVDGFSLLVWAWVTPTAIHSCCGGNCSDTIDGDLGTYWIHGVAHNHWIIFDLGTTKTVDKIKVYYKRLAAGRGYPCYVTAVYINNTADESGGSKGFSYLSVGGPCWREIDVDNTDGRYIKLKLQTTDSIGLCRYNQYLSHFYEFQAYVT